MMSAIIRWMIVACAAWGLLCVVPAMARTELAKAAGVPDELPDCPAPLPEETQTSVVSETSDPLLAWSTGRIPECAIALRPELACRDSGGEA